MKRKSLLFLLLLAIFVPWAAQAQVEPPRTKPTGLAVNYEGDETTERTNAASFTDLCMPEDMCEITFELTDSWGDGWNGNAIIVTDVTADMVLDTLTNDGTTNYEAQIFTLSVCEDHEIHFVWKKGEYPAEASWVVKDVNGEIITSGVGDANMSTGELLDTYIVTCAFNPCRKPTDLATTPIGSHNAVLNWTENSVGTTPVTEWIVAYKQAIDTVFTEVTATANPFTLEGLLAETEYVWKVLPYGCNDAWWSEEANFTTDVSCPAPTAVTIPSMTPYSAVVSWVSDAESFNLMFGETVIENVTNPYELTNLEPQTQYTVKVKAFCGGEDGESQWTVGVSFTTDEICPDGMICIGSGTTTSNRVPTFIDRNYSLTQQIYTADEMGEAGTIISADFYKSGYNSGNRSLNIYMVNTEKTSFENATDWITVTESDLVYSGYVSFTDNYWTTIVFDNPFVYDGVSNVAFIVDDNTGTWNAPPLFYAFSATNQTLQVYSDYTNYNPYAPSYTGTVLNMKNRVRFALRTPCTRPSALSVALDSYNSDTLKWVGESDTYTLRYRTAEVLEAILSDDFESGFINWNVIDADEDGYAWVLGSEVGGIYFAEGASLAGAGHNASGDFVTSGSYSNVTEVALTPDNYLVSPLVELGQSFSFWACAQDGSWPSEHFGVAVSTTSNSDPDAFTMVQEWTMTAKGTDAKVNPGTTRSGNRAQGTWYMFTAYLDEYLGQTGYIAIRHFGCTDNFLLNVDDIMYGVHTTAPAGEWVTIEGITDTWYLLGDLDQNTTYEFQVKGVCSEDESAWSPSAFFTTMADIPVAVVNGGYWNMSSTWINNGGEIPDPDQSVIIVGDVLIGEDLVVTGDITIAPGASLTIEPGVTFSVDNIYISSPDQLVIESGGTFMHTNMAPVTVLFNYSATGNGKDGEFDYGTYRLMASPFTPYVTVNSTGLVPLSDDPNYDYVDLYYFNQVGDSEGNEWVNYKDVNNHFVTFDFGKGYLYANTQNTLARFAGQTLPTDTPVNVELDYVEGARWAGWNLIGNPFTCPAYINYPFYTLNANGSAIAGEVASGSIGVMEGVFVVAEEAGESVTFTTTAPDKSPNLSLNLSIGSNLIDRAILRFDEGRTLPKFQLDPNHTKVYITMDNKDFAVVSASEIGEMPVSFKAEKNGTYTLNFAAQEVSFNYLHLIDNMTGADVDLLSPSLRAERSNPDQPVSYTFQAQTTDYANRFKLVYAVGSSTSSDTFAFYSNGNFVINNEGNATLQVVDVMGRIVKSESINGSASVSVNAATGVYMLRLINGNDVKVQKIVVR